jgi:heme/copper-type cytochrome/quinol oxidase subunit 3
VAHDVALSGHVEETTTGLDNRKMIMWIFLSSECLLFGSLIATYLVYHGKSLIGPFPGNTEFLPDGRVCTEVAALFSWDCHGIFNIPYTSISAFVLLMSSLTMVLALSALQNNDLRKTKIWIMATALLGMVFLGGQVFEFTTFAHDGLTLKSSLFGSSFFTLTGFHGAHVAIGVLILLSFYVQAQRGLLTQANNLNLELAGLYWHFVDVVWIVIFTVIYLFEAPNL